MGTKTIRISVLLAILASCTYSTCKKGVISNCADTAYSFQIGVKAYPDYDSIHVGDTLWFEINAPTTLQDGYSNAMIDYSGAQNLGTVVGFSQYVGKDSFTDAANLFDYKLISGVQVANKFTDKLREYLFTQTNNRYIFKLGIIPKQIGTFGSGVGNAANVYRNSDKCTKASFIINFDSTNQHYYLNPNIVNSNEDTLRPSGSYNFKVY